MPSPDLDERQEKSNDITRTLFEQAQGYAEAMQISEAREAFQLAEDAGFDADDCAAGRWTCHMLLGQFEAAWKESDAIGRRGNPDPHRFWDGRPLDGRHVMIRCLHGLGDTLQYIRYAALVRQRAATLTVEAQPPLLTLLEQAQIADKVITWGDEEPLWDQQIEIVELPRIFRTTIDSIPATVPYIRVPSGSLETSPATELRPLSVGLVWASSAFNPARSLLLNQLGPLLEIPNISFFSFQAGDESAQLAEQSSGITNVYRDGQSVLETAIGMKRMDLVITVDTMTAHLAGAMGIDVWTLLPHACDWRWMLHRCDSPWYPTMRLFRQHTSGDWRGVVDRVHGELISKAHHHRDTERRCYSPGTRK